MIGSLPKVLNNTNELMIRFDELDAVMLRVGALPADKTGAYSCSGRAFQVDMGHGSPLRRFVNAFHKPD